MRILVYSLLVLFIPLSLHASLNLTATPYDRNQEEVIFKALRFQDQDSDVFLDLPREWTWENIDASNFKLYPPKLSQAEVHFKVLRNPPFPLTKEELTLNAQTSLPKDATDIEIGKEITNPLNLHNIPFLEVQASYELFGEAFKRSVLYFSPKGWQLQITVVAPAAHFKEVHQEFFTSLFSLYWENGDALSPQSSPQ